MSVQPAHPDNAITGNEQRVNTAAHGALPLELLRELRTDHAGETGAVMIYRGVLAVARDAQVRAFAQHHLQTELRHLALINEVVPPRWRSRLLPLWRVSGWVTGALPACFGARAVYATIESVETFVDHHYAAQVRWIDDVLAAEPQHPQRARLLHLRALLEQCRLDEVAHRDDAAARFSGQARGLLALWRALVGRGSAQAVRLCRHI
ncbi:MAG: demethoxyubiquinone hydroxylase family protein [Burkholderiaceae bacterium]